LRILFTGGFIVTMQRERDLNQQPYDCDTQRPPLHTVGT